MEKVKKTDNLNKKSLRHSQVLLVLMKSCLFHYAGLIHASKITFMNCYTHLNVTHC